MSDTDLSKAKEDAENSVAAWLLTLELARASGEFERAAEAQRELRKRGVTVRYRRPARGEGQVHLAQ